MTDATLHPLQGDVPYAFQRLWHASPVLCPARALLARIPLGPRPSLHRLRSRLPGFVRRLPRYYGGVLTSHVRASLATAPRLPNADQRIREWPDVGSPGSRPRSFDTCQVLRPRRARQALRYRAWLCCLPPSKQRRHPEFRISWLNGWPMPSPTDASSTSLRTATHGSGPMWFATPSSCRTFTDYSLPVSRRTSNPICPAMQSGLRDVSRRDDGCPNTHGGVSPIVPLLTPRRPAAMPSSAA